MTRYQYLGAYIERTPYGWWVTANWDYEASGEPAWFATEREAQKFAEEFA